MLADQRSPTRGVPGSTTVCTSHRTSGSGAELHCFDGVMPVSPKGPKKAYTLRSSRERIEVAFVAVNDPELSSAFPGPVQGTVEIRACLFERDVKACHDAVDVRLEFVEREPPDGPIACGATRGAIHGEAGNARTREPLRN